MTKIDRGYILRNPSDTSLQDKKQTIALMLHLLDPIFPLCSSASGRSFTIASKDSFDQITDFSAENVSPPND